MQLTDIQFAKAWALASAYGHEWTRIVNADSPLRDPEEIRAAVVAAREENDIPGIDAPETDGGEVVHHTTGTGRTQWSVYPDGAVRIEISRPSGPVLHARVDPDGQITECAAISPLVLYAPRHVRALQDALAPIASGALEATWPLFPAPLDTYQISQNDCPLRHVDVPRGGGLEGLANQLLAEKQLEAVGRRIT